MSEFIYNTNPAVADVNTANQGYVFLPTIFYPPNTAGVPVLSANNQVRYIMVVIPFTIVVGQISVEVATKSASTGQKADFGLYSADGTTLILKTNAGIDVSSTITNGAFAVPIGGAPVTVLPGAYLFAYTCSDLAVVFRGMSDINTVAILGTQTVKKRGTAGNTATAGILPTSLGTLTTANAGNNGPLAILER